jgi:hypothetical protein
MDCRLTGSTIEKTTLALVMFYEGFAGNAENRDSLNLTSTVRGADRGPK